MWGLRLGPAPQCGTLRCSLAPRGARPHPLTLSGCAQQSGLLHVTHTHSPKAQQPSRAWVSADNACGEGDKMAPAALGWRRSTPKTGHVLLQPTGSSKQTPAQGLRMWQ